MDSDSRPTPIGPPPTSHFHVLTDTPSGLQPVNPVKTPQPSAAKMLLDMDKKDKEKEIKKEPMDIGSNFGLKIDQLVIFLVFSYCFFSYHYFIVTLFFCIGTPESQQL